MTVSRVLSLAQKAHLRSEMEVFLANLLGASRLDLLSHGEKDVPVERLSELQKGWLQLQEGVPVAYLTHEKEFYGIPLYVDERVLVPRGETEGLVDLVLGKGMGTVLELGTGSGAISIALKKTRPELELTATDISLDALEVANKNIVQYGLDVELIHSDLLDSVPGQRFDILVANLPYIGLSRHDFIAENVVRHEPSLALFGGDDGLQVYERLFKQIKDQKREFSWILGEMGFSQGRDLEALALRILPGYSCQICQDGQGLNRYFVLANKSLIC